MFHPFTLDERVHRFEGPGGWFYLPFDEALSEELRPLVAAEWPALLKVSARVGDFEWTATVMPIKDGPLFIALPAKVRKRLKIGLGDRVEVHIAPT